MFSPAEVFAHLEGRKWPGVERFRPDLRDARNDAPGDAGPVDVDNRCPTIVVATHEESPRRRQVARVDVSRVFMVMTLKGPIPLQVDLGVAHRVA